MFEFISQANFGIQSLIVAIIIGVFYNLWSNTKVYGGIIGTAVRFLGIGMLFMTVAIIERTMTNFHIIVNNPNVAMAQDIFSLIGLVFLALGFSKLIQATNVK